TSRCSPPLIPTGSRRESGGIDSAGVTAQRIRLLPMAVFAGVFTVYLAGMRYVGSGDTEAAELLPIALRAGDGFGFARFFSAPDVPYAFRRLNGRVVSGYPIGAGLANVPVYAVAKAAGVDLMANRHRLSLVTSAGLAALSVLFMYLALRRL